jgi:hypothetical protein
MNETSENFHPPVKKSIHLSSTNKARADPEDTPQVCTASLAGVRLFTLVRLDVPIKQHHQLIFVHEPGKLDSELLGFLTLFIVQNSKY